MVLVTSQNYTEVVGDNTSKMLSDSRGWIYFGCDIISFFLNLHLFSSKLDGILFKDRISSFLFLFSLTLTLGQN